MYRKILAPLLSGGHGMDAGVLGAFQIAREFNAHVEALYAHPSPQDVLVFLGNGFVGTMWDKVLHEAKAKIATDRKAAYDHFEMLCRQAGMHRVESASSAERPSVSWHEVTGQASDLLATDGRFADLIVLSKSAPEDNVFWQPAFEAALFASTRPVVLMPSRPVPRIGTKVLIAWNGSAQAMRAVTSALPFLQHAQSVLIGTVETDETPVNDAEKLRDYLAMQHVDATVQQPTRYFGAVGHVLLNQAAEADADLLVMGGYGHSRFREWMLGGATRDVLETTTVPVLMTH